MGQKIITLQIPDELYERLQEAAESSQRSPETVLLESLDLLLSPPSIPNIDEPLAELSSYSDTQLWAVVHRHLPWNQSLRLRELSAKGKQGDLTNDEQAELQYLLDRVDRDMLLRSEALLLLKQRGHDIDVYLKLGA